MTPTDFSLVLACYNEEPWLESSVREILRVLDSTRMSYEIIFVDDASRDRTREVVRGIMDANRRIPMRLLCHERNTGWGRTVADGIGNAGGEIVGFLDVDLEVHPRYLVACCLAVRGGAQVAVGARVFRFVARGLWRRFLSAGYAAMVRLLIPIEGLDRMASGCKCFRRADLLPVLASVEDPGWFWDLELMARCRLAGLSIEMVPCLYVRNSSKPSTVRVLRDGFECMMRLVALRRVLRGSRMASGKCAPSAR